ncbi:MAG: hypothetical protein Pg6A_11710 [Termitinemataceae bacterium]|nr:MAG: hypothetical protein Pg6A_11710 [Termitinemataceae bacterium]
MKKIVVLVLLVFWAEMVWGQNASDKQNVILIELVPDDDSDPFIYLYDGKIHYFLGSKYTILPNSLLYLGDDGYWRFKIDEKYIKISYYSWLSRYWPKYSSYKKKELVIIMGDGRTDTIYDYDYNGTSELKIHDNLTSKTISSSKYLIENVRGKTIKYAPANLLIRELPGEHIKTGRLSWIPVNIPWVEGEEGSGIGAFIEIEFNGAWDGFAILNGYVDPHKMKLFKENNRVKTMTAIDVDNKTQFDVDFEDYVYYKNIVFSKPTKHIKLIIKDVYKGTKYDDTCISAIRAFKAACPDGNVDNAHRLKWLQEAVEGNLSDLFGLPEYLE